MTMDVNIETRTSIHFDNKYKTTHIKRFGFHNVAWNRDVLDVGGV
jgi:hypothetical protein